jgi:hypothetical protein
MGIPTLEAHPDWPLTRWATIMGTTGDAIHREPWNKERDRRPEGAIQSQGHLGSACPPAADTLIVADGFSCCEQIEQGTGHGTLHLTVRH